MTSIGGPRRERREDRWVPSASALPAAGSIDTFERVDARQPHSFGGRVRGFRGNQPVRRGGRSAPAKSFEWGVSFQLHERDLNLNIAPERLEKIVSRLEELGVTNVRMEIPMKAPLENAVAVVSRIREAGIDVTPTVGVGGKDKLPAGMSADDPDYIDRMSAHVSEVATALAPLGIKNYQIENELNAAGLATSFPYSWREGKSWWKADFKEALLGSLAGAVKQADPDAKVHTNFHDQVSDQSLDDSIRSFSKHVDEVGVDFYPNYVVPNQLTGLISKDVGPELEKRIRHYQRLSGKPVRISETGYQTRSPLGHDPAGQYRFARQVAKAARNSGAVGMTYFRLADGAPKDGLVEQIEGSFGLLDENLEPKVTRQKGENVSSFDALKRAIQDDRAP